MNTSFFSYSRSDQDFAFKLADDLRKNNIDIWFDQYDIPSGALWDVEIENALSKCDTFIVIISNHSVKSKNVLDEISYAIEENKKVIPIKISDCEIPFRIRRLQYIDFSTNYGKGFKTLMDSYNKPLVEGTILPIKNNKFNKKIIFGLVGIVVLVGMLFLLRNKFTSNPISVTEDSTLVQIDTANNTVADSVAQKEETVNNEQFILAKTLASSIKVVAKYPLLKDAYPEYNESDFKGELEQNQFIQFKDGGAYVSGKYIGNYIADEVIGTATLPYNKFDINSFCISLHFKIKLEDKAMPILYIGESCRQFGIEISNTNNFLVRVNNMSETHNTSTKIEADVWNEIMLIYKKNNVSFYVNKVLAADFDYELNDCITNYEKTGIKILSANYGNGIAFKGYWKDLYIYNLVY